MQCDNQVVGGARRATETGAEHLEECRDTAGAVHTAAQRERRDECARCKEGQARAIQTRG